MVHRHQICEWILGANTHRCLAAEGCNELPTASPSIIRSPVHTGTHLHEILGYAQRHYMHGNMPCRSSFHWEMMAGMRACMCRSRASESGKARWVEQGIALCRRNCCYDIIASF